MGLFNRKKDTDKKKPADKQDEKKEAVKAVKIKDAKKMETVKEQPVSDKTSMKDLYSGAAQTQAKTDKKTDKAKIKYHDAYKILIKPLVTEKVSNLGVLNKYIFAVNIKANKIEIAKAINAVYGIKPLKVNVIKMTGKQAGYAKIKGKRKDWKKAIITLPAGQTIKVYEGV